MGIFAALWPSVWYFFFRGSELRLERYDSYGNFDHLEKKSNIFILGEFCKRTQCPAIETLALLFFLGSWSVFCQEECKVQQRRRKRKKTFLPPPPPFRGGGAIWNISPFLGLYSRPTIRTKKRTRSTQKFGVGPLRNTSPFLELYSRPPIRTKKRTWSTQKCGLGPC